MGRLNPWLEQKLKEVKLGPEMLDLLVEFAPGTLETVRSQLKFLPQVTVGRPAFNLLEIRAPVEVISKIAAIPEVVMVHKNMVKKMFPLPMILGRLPTALSYTDPLEGRVQIDNIVCPRKLIKPDLALPLSPLRLLTGMTFKIIPTSETRKALVDYDGLTGKGVKIAVLDTGLATLLPTKRARIFSTCLTDPLPTDFHSHGSWCCSAAAGTKDRGFYGECEGIAPQSELISIKVLHGIFGFGMSMDIIYGMELAAKLGARVISMSLGGDICQGGCYGDDGGPCPECKTVKTLADQGVLVVIAAANSGPDPWTIGCPGCCPAALTVGSMSLTDGEVAVWSSRGPQNPANRDVMVINDTTMKPDVLSLGGGRHKTGEAMDEVIYSPGLGWMHSLYTGIPEPFATMHGSSQACPQFAGLCALALEYGIVGADVKAKISAGKTKNPDSGWGLIALSNMLSTTLGAVL